MLEDDKCHRMMSRRPYSTNPLAGSLAGSHVHCGLLYIRERLLWRHFQLPYRMQEAIAEGLVDRLADCKRVFPTAAVINGAGPQAMLRSMPPSTMHNACVNSQQLPVCRAHAATSAMSHLLPAGENVLRRLAGGRSGIQEVLLLDTSREMLHRAQHLQVAFWLSWKPHLVTSDPAPAPVH